MFQSFFAQQRDFLVFAFNVLIPQDFRRPVLQRVFIKAAAEDKHQNNHQPDARFIAYAVLPGFLGGDLNQGGEGILVKKDVFFEEKAFQQTRDLFVEVGSEVI